jgi:RNA polymerase sigma-70 factor (ECF subfamily)
MERIEDQQLLERFFSGEDESFEVIVSKYESRVFHTALYLTETSEDAEMVLQEVFLELHAKLLSDMGKTPLFDWLLQRTLDISVDRLINKKQEVVELPEHATTYQSMSEHVTSFTDRHENFCTSLQRATRNLPETLKFVFLLRDIQGLSLSRVSSILGINVFEARNRLHQARLRIHSELAQLTEYEVRRVSESR